MKRFVLATMVLGFAATAFAGPIFPRFRVTVRPTCTGGTCTVNR